MRDRSRSRWLTFAAVVGFASTVSTGGCNLGNTGPAGDLAEARERWAHHGPPSYVVTIERSCACLPEMSGPVVVTVRSGTVESRQYVRTGTAVTAQYADLFPTIDGLFAIIEEGMRDGTRPFLAYYDATLGYPTRIELGDPAVDAPVYSVTELRPVKPGYRASRLTTAPRSMTLPVRLTAWKYSVSPAISARRNERSLSKRASRSGPGLVSPRRSFAAPPTVKW